MSESVVLVDDSDQRQGTAEKLRAHVEGQLHRAFSVFVFDREHRLLLQRRARNKYHSGGLWSNTCCSHPRPGETPEAAAKRRLQEEMGFSCAITPAFSTTYKTSVGDDLIEHEYVHVFIGTADGIRIQPDPEEVSEWAWVEPSALRDDVESRPERYTPWFRLLLDDALAAAAPQ